MGRLENGNSNGARTPELLLIDDENEIFRFVSRSLDDCRVTQTKNWREAKSLLSHKKIKPRIVFIEPSSDPDSALADQIEGLGLPDSVPVVIFSVNRQPRTIIEATRHGVLEYLVKPAKADHLRGLVERILSNQIKRSIPANRVNGNGQRPVKQNGNGHHKRKNGFLLVGEPIRQIQKLAEQIADSSVPVLIEGESGVGKEVVARLLHLRSSLRDSTFIKLNCAALPTDLIESELFGHTRGAFTGAHEDRSGKFLAAHGGTLFLDEIGEFSRPTQAKLLQVLQDGRFTPLGKDKEIQVDVRVIAATNRDLSRAVEKGDFREDLFYRLNVIRVEIPPLRERVDEILAFSEYFLEKFSRELSISPPKLPSGLLETFLGYHWPGNVRELENLVRRFILLGNAEQIEAELNGNHSAGGGDDRLPPQNGKVNGAGLKAVGKRAAAKAEHGLILRTLKETGGNKWQAAKKLGVSYKTLLSRIDSYGIKSRRGLEAVAES